MVNHFFAWFEGETEEFYGGLIDKFIGGEIMIVFLQDICKKPPLETAMYVAKKMLEKRSFCI